MITARFEIPLKQHERCTVIIRVVFMMQAINYMYTLILQPPSESMDVMCYKMYCWDTVSNMCVVISEQKAAMGTPCGHKKVYY